MTATYALDTNTISYILDREKTTLENFFTAINRGDEIVIPCICYYEIVRGLLKRDAKKKLARFEEFCNEVDIIDMNMDMWHRAAKIYVELSNKGRPSGGDSDILIASLCLANGYIIVTNNSKHFESIEGLKIVDWK